MYQGAKISVVMPAYNEEAFIAQAVADFKALPEVDEVVVVDNNCSDRTAELARAAGARVVQETKQGYGHASRRALLSATGDWVFIVEPDGTFRPEDVYKFLPYGHEFDAVIGTRTAKSCIWQGANMGWFLRYGNVAVAKLLEYLHNGPCFTDVGCTFKMVKRGALEQVAPFMTVGKSYFSPELMVVLVRTGMRCVEIPVHYRSRRGTSKITGDLKRAFRLGMRMIRLIIEYRFRRFPRLQTTVTDQTLKDIGEYHNVRKPAKSAASSKAAEPAVPARV
jgi:glycosyltransferase involved in cell wall biosynthesis